MAVAHIYLVDDLVKRVNFAITNSTTVDSTLDSDIRWALEEALMNWIVETRPQDLTTTGTVTTANGTAEYSLPDDFWEMRPNGVRIDGSPYTTLCHLQKEAFQRLQLYSNTGTGTPSHYAILQRSASTAIMSIRFYPIPNATLSIKVDYVALPSRPSTTTSGDGAYLDKRVPPALILPLVRRAALIGFSHMLDASQQAAFADAWATALRLSKDTAVKQGGVIVTPEAWNPATDGGGYGDGAFQAPNILT